MRAERVRSAFLRDIPTRIGEIVFPGLLAAGHKRNLYVEPYDPREIPTVGQLCGLIPPGKQLRFKLVEIRKRYVDSN